MATSTTTTTTSISTSRRISRRQATEHDLSGQKMDEKQDTTSSTSSSTGSSIDDGNDKDDEDDDDNKSMSEEFDVHSVSEATALLACRAYLQRKHRLGPWEKGNERKRQQASSPPRFVFWEEDDDSRSSRRMRVIMDKSLHPHQHDSNNKNDTETSLTAAATTTTSHGIDRSGEEQHPEHKREQVVGNDEDSFEEDAPTWELALRTDGTTLQEMEVVEELCDDFERQQTGGGGTTTTTTSNSYYHPHYDFSVQDQDEENEEEDESSSAAATCMGWIYDDFPDPSHVKRSQAARRTWSNSTFREKWYQARWGGGGGGAHQLKNSNNYNNKLMMNKKKKSSKNLPTDYYDFDQKDQSLFRRFTSLSTSTTAGTSLNPITAAATTTTTTDSSSSSVFRRSSSFPMEEIAAMTEDEITQAIRSYVSSKQKRRLSREQTKKERQEAREKLFISTETATQAEAATSTPKQQEQRRKEKKEVDLPVADRMQTPPSSSSPARESLLLPSVNLLQQRRQERALRATKAYQTRLENQQKQQQQQPQKQKQGFPSILTSRSLPAWRYSQRHSWIVDQKVNNNDNNNNPIDALVRIEAAIESGLTPIAIDVELVLKPARLTRRKEVLCRLLAGCFGLRGKCVPPLVYLKETLGCGGGSAAEDNDDAQYDGPLLNTIHPASTTTSELIFVSHATVEHLGAFCLWLIQQKESNKTAAVAS